MLNPFLLNRTSSSSSIGTATLVGFGLLNYRWVFSAGRFLQGAVASGTSNPQPGGPVIRTFQLPPTGVPHVWNPTAEGGTMGEKFPRILPKVATSTSLLGSFTCRKFTTWNRRLYLQGLLYLYKFRLAWDLSERNCCISQGSVCILQTA